MLTRAIIKLIRSLDQKKFRLEHNIFVAEGHKIVGELLKSDIKFKYIIASKEWLGQNKQLPNAEIIEVSERELQQVSFLKTPQKVMAVCYIPDRVFNTENFKNELILAVDDIQDPGNMGTIIRIADWFGIKNIIATQSTADLYNPKVIQATMGAFARVNIYYSRLPELLIKLKDECGLTIYGTTLKGENIYKQNLKTTGVIVMGSEGNGISDEVMATLTSELYIPPYATNTPTSESLNVATATAIVCAEFRRQSI